MRSFRFLLLAGVLSLLAGAHLLACGDPFEGVPLKLPGTPARTIIRGDALFAVTTDGSLLTVDLRTHTVRNLGNFDTKLAPVLDAANGKACVASQKRALLVDLKTAKVLHSVACEAGVQDIGFVDDNRLYIMTGPNVAIVDLAEGKTLHTIDLGKGGPAGHRGALVADAKGKRLLVPTMNDKPALAVIDLNKGVVIDRVPMPGMVLGGIHATGDLCVVGDKLFIVCLRFSYGVWTESFGCVDLKERTYSQLQLPAKVMHARELQAGLRGQVYLCGFEGAHLYDSQGKLIGPALDKIDGRLVGVWRRLACIVKGQELQRVGLSSLSARSR